VGRISSTCAQAHGGVPVAVPLGSPIAETSHVAPARWVCHVHSISGSDGGSTELGPAGQLPPDRLWPRHGLVAAEWLYRAIPRPAREVSRMIFEPGPEKVRL
jgi:hypothetical protein